MSQIEDVLAEVENLKQQYQDILDFYSPSTLKEALKNEWEGGEKIDHLLISYAPYKERRHDKQRLISMKTAMAVLRDMEEQLVGSLIPTWDDLLWSQLVGTYQAIIQTVVAIVNNWSEVQRAGIILRIWKIVKVAYQMVGMISVAKTIFKIEQRYELQIASKKMKQTNGRRQRVKKITRT